MINALAHVYDIEREMRKRTFKATEMVRYGRHGYLCNDLVCKSLECE
jgi:hypothetical protein